MPFLSLFLFSFCFAVEYLVAAEPSPQKSFVTQFNDKAKGIFKGLKDNAQENPTPYYLGGAVAIGTTGAAVGTGLAVSHFLNKKLSKLQKENKSLRKEILNTQIEVIKKGDFSSLRTDIEENNLSNLEKKLKRLENPGRVINKIEIEIRKAQEQDGDISEIKEENPNPSIKMSLLDFSVLKGNHKLFKILLDNGGKSLPREVKGLKDDMTPEEKEKHLRLDSLKNARSLLEESRNSRQLKPGKIEKKEKNFEEIERLIHERSSPAFRE